MPTVADYYRTYVERAMPPTAGAAQHQETRRAFYAGARAMFRLLTEDLDPGDEPTVADLLKVEALSQELLSFSEAVQGGRA